MPLEMTMVKIQIDGKYYEVKPEKNLLETCLSLGLDIPHFCYHPALGSVGACRLCAVKKFRDQNDTRGRIVMSCMEPVAEGLMVSIDDPEAKAFRAAVIESLMTNHPHDCPVCDEGGECHLQDMTVMTGHNYRRFDFKKRTYENQDLGPFINHEMNRCIQCYRCVRFYRDYSGGKDLNVFASHNHVYFGRQRDGILENEFSGNLVEVCPTGVFTDKTLKNHFTRKWDLSNAPSVCVHCSVGCNTIISERYDLLRRVMNRYNGAVNGHFICDRGRFGYEFVNDENRVKTIRIRNNRDVNQKETDPDQILPILESSFSKDKRIIGIGSPRASLESNYALSVLAGNGNFYHGISKKEQLLTSTVLNFMKNSGVEIPSLKQIEHADVMLILGEDLTNTAPMISLAIRQAIRNNPAKSALRKGIPLWNDAPVRELAQSERSPLYVATPMKDRLDEIAEMTFRGSFKDISKLGLTVASLVADKIRPSEDPDNETGRLAEKIAVSLKEAENPLIVSGITCGDENVLRTGMSIAEALLSLNKKVMFIPVMPECNSMGLALIPGKAVDDAVADLSDRKIDTLIVLENDLFRRISEKQASDLFSNAGKIIVLDHLNTPTAQAADIVLPAATFAESTGTIVNNEGRAQRYYKALNAKGQAKDSWRWLKQFIKIKDDPDAADWKRFNDVAASMADEIEELKELKGYKPDADFRMLNTKIPRQTLRYSGRTAMNAHLAVSEKRVMKDPDSSLAFSMEGRQESPPSSLVPFYWSPGWNSVQSLFTYLDEPNGSMKGGDPGIRLIEHTGKRSNTDFERKSGYKVPLEDEWLIVPVYHIFGSEELSSAASTLKQLIAGPLVFLNRSDSKKLGVENNDLIRLSVSGNELVIKVKIEDSLKSGIAGLSVNLPGMKFIDLPASGRLLNV